MTRTTSLLKFADMHVHLRDEPGLLAPYTSSTCARALVMPNTKPPLITNEDLVNYSSKLPDDCEYQTLMYLKCDTTPHDIEWLPESTLGVKLYPAATTTHSAEGIPEAILREPRALNDILSALDYFGRSFHVHAEMPGSFTLNSEADFIPLLANAARDFPKLRIVVEHVTTAAMVDWIISTPQALGTITPQHLRYDMSSLFEGGLRPHRFCKPVYKRPQDRDSLWRAVHHERFLLGSDSAPHATSAKLQDCGCAGVWNAPVLAPVLVHMFDQAGLLYLLPEFTRLRAERYWPSRSQSQETITLTEQPFCVPATIGGMVPMCAGETLDWGPGGDWQPIGL